MVATNPDIEAEPLPRRALLIAGLLLVSQLVLIGTVFKHGIDFRCLDNWPPAACKAASGTMVSLYCMLGAVLLFSLLRPGAIRHLFSQAGERVWPLAINLAGAALSFAPVLLLNGSSGAQAIAPSFAFWTIGMGLLLGGLALYLAPLDRWGQFIRDHAMTLAAMICAGAVAPVLAVQIRPLWHLETISQLTFEAVAFLVHAVGYEPVILPGTKVIGSDEFAINVAPQCSGVEGFALVTIFVTIYLCLFRHELRFPRALLLYPIGLAASAAFNVVRIAALLIIGMEGNTELAVGAFHSHAGWLMFTLVALGIVVAAQSVPALQKTPQRAAGPVTAAPLPPFFQDPTVARILPFGIFMFSAQIAQVFTNTPGAVYPLRALAMAAGLALFWQVLARLPWRIDPVAAAAGAVIGIGWVLIPYEVTDTTPAYGALTGGMLIAWLIVRGIGTIVLVPVIEELFFRDYLEGKLRAFAHPLLAALITAGLFAVLHDRWAEAFVAGLIFSWVMQRRGNVTDAILAHLVANLIVYAAALATGQMHII